MVTAFNYPESSKSYKQKDLGGSGKVRVIILPSHQSNSIKRRMHFPAIPYAHDTIATTVVHALWFHAVRCKWQSKRKLNSADVEPAKHSHILNILIRFQPFFKVVMNGNERVIHWAWTSCFKPVGSLRMDVTFWLNPLFGNRDPNGIFIPVVYFVCFLFLVVSQTSQKPVERIQWRENPIHLVQWVGI